MTTFPLLEKPDGLAQPWALSPEMTRKFWHQPQALCPAKLRGIGAVLPGCLSQPPTPLAEDSEQEPTCSLLFLGPRLGTSS